MTRATETLKIFSILPRALAVVLALSAPVLAVSSLQAGNGATIEAPTMKNTGAGFVLMVSLRRG